mmetsp:Transcript_129138/g.346376  ORF Transcript_129138/g.346376 Transcript_129138/m.346376 type:complete len:282 (+) Transcript_129138:260-1105(+)
MPARPSRQRACAAGRARPRKGRSSRQAGRGGRGRGAWRPRGRPGGSSSRGRKGRPAPTSTVANGPSREPARGRQSGVKKWRAAASSPHPPERQHPHAGHHAPGAQVLVHFVELVAQVVREVPPQQQLPEVHAWQLLAVPERGADHVEQLLGGAAPGLLQQPRQPGLEGRPLGVLGVPRAARLLGAGLLDGRCREVPRARQAARLPGRGRGLARALGKRRPRQEHGAGEDQQGRLYQSTHGLRNAQRRGRQQNGQHDRCILLNCTTHDGTEWSARLTIQWTE